MQRRSLTAWIAAFLLLVGALALTASTAHAAVGGPVILGGDDLDDHGDFNTGTNANEDGWLYLQRALENVSPKVSRPNDGTIAAIGSSDSTNTGGGDGGAAIHYAAEKAGLSVNYYDGADAINSFFTALASGSIAPRIIWISGDQVDNALDECTGAGTEGEALTNHANVINDFVNQGGGLISHGTCYTWLTTLISGIQSTDSGSSDDLYFTPDGSSAFPGITTDNINAGPWHSNFDGNLGGLQVLVRSSSVKDQAGNDAPVIIGGAGVSLTQKQADLALTKTDSPDPVAVGSNLTYTLSVKDNGPGDGTNVTVVDKLPAGATFVSATAAGGSCSGTGTVTCKFASIPNGSTATATIVVRPTATGTLTNTADISSADQPDPNTANNHASADTRVIAAVVARSLGRPSVSIAGMPRGCMTRARTVKLRIRSSNATSVRVFLNGKLIARKKRSFTLTIAASRLNHHSNSLRVVSRGVGGTRTRSARITICRAAAPRFTG